MLWAVREEHGYPVVWPQDPQDWIAGADLAGFVAVDSGALIGHVAIQEAAHADHGTGGVLGDLWSGAHGRPLASCALLSRLFVAPTRAGGGVGAALLDAAVDWMRERDLAPCLDLLPIDARQRPTRRLQEWYQRHGWRVAGEASPTWRQEGWPPLVAMTLPV